MKKEQYQIKKIKKPWPTKDAMEQIYEMNLWGGDQYDFYSGEGSHRADIVQPYVNVLISFLSSFENSLTVCDLGCGDFNVGKELVKFTQQYIAVDIVPALIARNREKFSLEKLKFECLDIAVDDVPIADCAILRQVLQHLSNEEVQKIVGKLADFKYVIITEHLPARDFLANQDIISGQGIRIKKQSGVDVIAPPFNFKVKEEKELVSINLPNQKGVIVTTFYRVF